MASRGIGAAIATGLAVEGCRVAIVARGDEGLNALAERLRATGADILPIAADLTERDAAARLVGKVESTLGAMDILINNLGGGKMGDDDEAWRFTLDVNLLASVWCCRAAIPGMNKRRSGVITIVSSISGSMVGGGMPSYNVAKAAEIMYARTLARDLAPFGIRANTISPGSIMLRRRLGAPAGFASRGDRRLRCPRHAPRPLRYPRGDRRCDGLPQFRPRVPDLRGRH